MLFAHKRVAEVDVEIRLVGERVGEGFLVEVRVGVGVEVRVRRDREREGFARRLRGLKRKFRAGGFAEMQLVKIPGIGLERRQHDFDGFSIFECPRRRLRRELSRLVSVSNKSVGVLSTKDAGRDGIRLGPAEDDVERMGWHVVAPRFLLRHARPARAAGRRISGVSQKPRSQQCEEMSLHD